MSLSRRQLLQLGVAGSWCVAAAPWLFAPQRTQTQHQLLVQQLRPAIKPRAQWAQGLAAKGRIPPEEPKFLVIHHTASANGYSAQKVPALLRSFYHHHTGAKGWPDVAYNFFVDRYGGIWEGRSGSLAGPVAGSATGGNQGYAQLCCFVGNFTAVPPTPAAQIAMQQLLAWLAVRYEIELTAQPTITFISRGSNKWPAGKQVRTAAVAGHRDMSLTACPGDALYGLIAGSLLPAAAATVAATRPVQSPQPQTQPQTPAPQVPTTTPALSPSVTVPATTPASTALASPSTATATATHPSSALGTIAPSASAPTTTAGSLIGADPAADLPIWLLVGGGSLAVLGAGAMVATRKLTNSPRQN